MKHFGIFLTAFCVTLLTAAALAQPAEPAATSNASRRQSGTVGPPLDAASMNPPAASVRPSAPATAPAATSAPADAAAPVPQVEPATASDGPATSAPAESVRPAQPAPGTRASRRASGRVTEADGSVPLATRPDRN